jgi:uncharacterized membrane protein YbhN (UPF0104 family)
MAIGKVKRGFVRWCLRLIGPLALAVFLARSSERRVLGASVASVSLPLIAAAVAMNFASVHAKVARWRLLLPGCAGRAVPYPVGRAWSAYLAAGFAGILTPGRVGDALRAVYAREHAGIPLARGMVSVIADRLCDLALLGILAIASSFALPLGIHERVVLVGVACLAAGGPVLAFGTPMIEALVSMAPRRVRERFGLDAWSDFVRRLRRLPVGLLARAMGWTVLAFAVNCAQGCLIASAAAIHISPAAILGMLSAASLLSLLPVSIAGLGVREAFFAAIFVRWGLPPESGVAFGLGVFVAMHLSLVAAGLVAWQLAPPPLWTGGRARDVGPSFDDIETPEEVRT